MKKALLAALEDRREEKECIYRMQLEQNKKRDKK